MKSMRWSLFTVLANGRKKGAVSWRVNKSLLNWKKSVIITGFLVNILFDSKQYYTKFASFWSVLHQSTLAFFLMLLNCPIALMAGKKETIWQINSHQVTIYFHLEEDKNKNIYVYKLNIHQRRFLNVCKSSPWTWNVMRESWVVARKF